MLEIRDLNKAYGALKVTDGISVTIEHGELLAVIGPNGAGKTSLIAQIAGELRSDSGEIWLGGVDVSQLDTPRRCRAGLARTYQISSLFKGFSVLDNVRLALLAHRGHNFRFWRPVRAEPTITDASIELIDRVGLSQRPDAIVGDLAHGEQRQLEIAMALAGSPRVLLLDEPTAGMGADDSARMMELIRKLKRSMTIILIEHDMPTVFSLADRITVLVRGRAIITAKPNEVRSSEEVKQSYLGDSSDA